MTASRRSFLASAVTSTAVASAGCLGDESSEPFEDHPSTANIETQPSLGDPDAAGVVVAFEDPSCSSCRRFEERTFPRLREELVAPGDVRFVYRTIDVVFQWAVPATQIMASTYATDAEVFWDLKDFYYENQSAFESNTVFDLSREFLESETELDADAVLDAAQAKTHDDFLQYNREAAQDVGLSATPEFYLFRNGTFRTEVSGAQDFDVFESALGFD